MGILNKNNNLPVLTAVLQAFFALLLSLAIKKYFFEPFIRLFFVAIWALKNEVFVSQKGIENMSFCRQKCRQKLWKV